MPNQNFWTKRLSETMLDASRTDDPHHQRIYLDLARHYSSMARACACAARPWNGQRSLAEMDIDLERRAYASAKIRMSS